MIRGKYLTSLDDTAQVMALRARHSPAWSVDAMDDMAVYALIFDEGGAPAGTGRLTIEDDQFTVSRVFVTSEMRRQGVGDLIMRMLLYRAQDLGAPSVQLVSPVDTLAFFARYGFAPLCDAFEREGAPHRLMGATAAQLDLAGECHKQPGRCRDCAGQCAGCQAQ